MLTGLVVCLIEFIDVSWFECSRVRRIHARFGEPILQTPFDVPSAIMKACADDVIDAAEGVAEASVSA